MLDWLKGTASALVVAVLAFFAAMSVVKARSHKKAADKWRETATGEMAADVATGTTNASKHLTQAKLHDARAKEAKAKAREKLDSMGKQDAEMATILSGWRSSRIN